MFHKKNKFIKTFVFVSVFAYCSEIIYTSSGNSQSQSGASSQEIFYAQRTQSSQETESFPCAQQSESFNFESSLSLLPQELDCLSSSMMPPAQNSTSAFEKNSDVSYMQDVYKNLSSTRKKVAKGNEKLDTTPSASPGLLFLVRSRLLSDMHTANIEALGFLSSVDGSFEQLFNEKVQSHGPGSAGSSDSKFELARELADGKNLVTYMKHCIKQDQSIAQPKPLGKRKHGAISSELDSK